MSFGEQEQPGKTNEINVNPNPCVVFSCVNPCVVFLLTLKILELFEMKNCAVTSEFSNDWKTSCDLVKLIYLHKI